MVCLLAGVSFEFVAEPDTPSMRVWPALGAFSGKTETEDVGNDWSFHGGA